MSQFGILDHRVAGMGCESPPDSPAEFEDPYLGNAIDWQAAAPSWWGILAGMVFPAVLALALLALIDIGVSALLHSVLFTGLPTWQLAVVMPAAFFCVLALVRRL